MGLTLWTVYNCRSSNAWDKDLALTATYFPHCGITFAILFGCPLSVEKDVLKRLSFAMTEAAHPLLMPGIFAEIERIRQVPIVESTIDELEARILQLDFQSSDIEIPEDEAEEQNKQKRAAWLNTTYLRNALVSWNTQLAKIRQHADELNAGVFKSARLKSASTYENIESDGIVIDTPIDRSEPVYASFDDGDDLENRSIALDGERLNFEQEKDGINRFKNSQGIYQIPNRQKNLGETNEQLRRVGQKIKDRIQGIIDEYDDKIRDCTMRVDGMAMATQWARIPSAFALVERS